MNLTEFTELASRAVRDQAETLPDRIYSPEMAPLASLVNDLLRENRSLRHDHRVAETYIRAKINQMLAVIGTAPLKPEELDEKHLIALDPLGIISRSFIQILEHSNRTNSKLRLARDEIQAIFDSVGGGLLVMDAERRILTANSRFQEMFSTHVDDISGRACHQIVCGREDAPRETCCFKRMIENGRTATQTDWRLGDKHYSVVATPIKDRAGRIVRCVVLYIDITELIEARIALDDERERLFITLESIADGVIATDNRGCVSLMNRVAETLIGWPESEALGQPISEVMTIENQIAPKSCAEFFSDLMPPRKARAERFDSTTLIDRQGTRRDIYLSASPIHQQDTTVAGTIVVFRDITLEKRLDEELAKANRLESLGIFAGGIAHDFNNLLTGVLGNISLAKVLTNPREKIHRLLTETEKSTYRAKGLTQQLLTFAKGGMPVKKLVAARELLQESVQFSLRGSRVSCTMRIADDLQPVEVDEGQLNQVIQNLAINALQAMQEQGGVIEVSADNVEIAAGQEALLTPGSYIRIAIADHGSGISPEIIDRIFDPFFTTKKNGSGLGLATSYAIVSKHQGHLTVESTVGQGATFFLYLPAAKREPAAKPSPAPEPPTGSGRVLVMDDEELVRTVTRSMLEFNGYEVELTSDGDEAIAKYQSGMQAGKPFDLVLMDLTIPGGMGGKEAIARLLVIDPKVRAIVASGYSNDPVMANYRSHGFRKVIPKPYTLKELIATVSEVLDDSTR
jgi:PAS domain S-box-containing protein